MQVSITVNGVQRNDDVEPRLLLAHYLRDTCGLKATNIGCDTTSCGACTVHVDGVPLRSCQLPVGTLGSRAVTTIEAIGATPAGARIQRAWLDHEVVQCGYCQSGQIMAATALLNEKPKPTDADIDSAMSGNICRCGTYVRIREAIHAAASA